LSLENFFYQPSLLKGQKGVILRIKVVTRSSKIGPLGVINDSLKWGVSAAPVDGEANNALIASISSRFSVPKSSVCIIGGEKSKLKSVFIAGIMIESVTEILTSQGRIKKTDKII
jgi:uncharacterized protein YggU (UPF0235/DUF167 family)